MQDDNEKEEKNESGADFDIGIRFEDDVEEAPEATLAVSDELNPEKPLQSETEGGDPPVSDALRELRQQVQQLSEAFDTKLKYDDHKNKIIDELHRELQEFREGIIKKHLHSMITDTIKIIDDIRKLKAHYETEPEPENAVPDLLNSMEDIASDLEDQFSWQGVMPFTCEGPDFDYTRQRVVKKIETNDPGMDKKIATSLRPGYEWEGKVIRPEMVAVYIYNDASNQEGIAE